VVSIAVTGVEPKVGQTAPFVATATLADRTTSDDHLVDDVVELGPPSMSRSSCEPNANLPKTASR
jgi:hypothetical protein